MLVVGESTDIYYKNMDLHKQPLATLRYGEMLQMFDGHQS